MTHFRPLLFAAIVPFLCGCELNKYYAERTPEQAARDQKYLACLAYVNTFRVQYPQEQFAYWNLCAIDPDRALAMQPPPPISPVPVVIVGEQ